MRVRWSLAPFLVSIVNEMGHRTRTTSTSNNSADNAIELFIHSMHHPSSLSSSSLLLFGLRCRSAYMRSISIFLEPALDTLRCCLHQKQKAATMKPCDYNATNIFSLSQTQRHHRLFNLLFGTLARQFTQSEYSRISFGALATKPTLNGGRKSRGRFRRSRGESDETKAKYMYILHAMCDVPHSANENKWFAKNGFIQLMACSWVGCWKRQRRRWQWCAERNECRSRAVLVDLNFWIYINEWHLSTLLRCKNSHCVLFCCRMFGVRCARSFARVHERACVCVCAKRAVNASHYIQPNGEQGPTREKSKR